MSDKVTCGACNRSYAFKPELAGKTAKCKCGNKITFPDQAESTAQEPLADVCPNCSATLAPNAVLCTRCGYNKRTGSVMAGARAAATSPASSGAESKRGVPGWAKAAIAAVIVALAGGAAWWAYSSNSGGTKPAPRRSASSGGGASPAGASRGRAQEPPDRGLLEELELKGPADGVNAMAFSPNGKVLAAAGRDKLIYLFDVETGKELQRLEGHAEPATDIRYSPDGKHLVSAGPDGLLIWDASSGRKLQTIDPKGKVTQARFLGNDRVATATGSRVQIWKVEAGEGKDPERVIDTGNEISCFDVSPNGLHLVVGQSAARVIAIVELASGVTVADREQRPTDPIRYVPDNDRDRMGRVQETTFIDNDHVLVGAREAGTYVWEWENNKVEDFEISTGNPDRPQAWAVDGWRIMWNIAGTAGLRFYDMSKGVLQSPRHSEHTGRMVPVNVANTPSSVYAIKGEWAAMGYAKEEKPPRGQPRDYSKIYLIKVSSLDAALAQERQSIQRDLDRRAADALAKSQTPRGKLLTAFEDAVKQSSIPAKTIRVAGESMTRIRFSPDGKYLAAAGTDRVVRLYDTESWEEVKTLDAHSRAVVDISFSPDGKRLLSTSSDSTIVLWDVQSGRIEGRVGSASRVFRGALLPDGKRAVTAGFYVQFWDMEKERQTGVGETEQQAWGLAVSPKGDVVTLDNSDTITVWDAATARPVQRQQVKQMGIRAYFSDDTTLRYFAGGKGIDWNIETQQTKPSVYADVGFTPDGNLGVGEHQNIFTAEGSRGLIRAENPISPLSLGAIDPRGRYIAYGSSARWEKLDYVSPQPGIIVVYDVKKLNTSAEAARKLAAYDQENNLDEEGRPR